EILLGCNRRYIAHLSALDDFSAGIRALGRLSKRREVDGKTVQGINFFAPVDSACCTSCKTLGSTSPAFAGASCCRISACSRQLDCRDNCAGCSTSGSSNASPEPTATTSPRPDVPRPQRRNASPRRLSFRL